ncbi:iron-sulfur cluster assembly protein, partial [Lacisediminihabitans profunda]
MAVALAPQLFDQVEEAPKDVMDPQLGVNIVDLGPIYALTWDEENNALII